MMIEINRILKMGGHLVLTTPNIASMRAVAGILQGFHPMLFPAYIRPRESGEVDARHNREYTALEIRALLEISGFEVALLDTGPFLNEPKPEFGWVEHLLRPVHAVEGAPRRRDLRRGKEGRAREGALSFLVVYLMARI